MSRTKTTVVGLMLLSLLVVGTASAQNHAAPYLRIGVGAKAMAMGTAYTAVAEDATAAYWNPAALVTLRRFEASLMYTAGMKIERNYNYISGTFNHETLGAFSLSWINSGVAGIDQRDALANPTGELNVSDNAFQLSYAHTFGTGLAMGLSGKFLQENLQNDGGYGFDAGILLKPYDELQFGAMVRDLSGKYGDFTTPYEARLGIGVKPWKRFTLDADFIKVQDEEATAALGGNYRVDVTDRTNFYIAAGMNDLLRDSRGFTAGFGVGFANFDLQYAYVTEPQKFLDQNHRISVNFFFSDHNPFKSMFGSLKREKKAAMDCGMGCKRDEGPKEFVHRYIFEGNPSLKLSLELLKPEQRDSIKQIFSEVGGVVSFPGVNFATGSAEITNDFARVLDGAAQLISEHPEIQLIEVQGHTDNTGTDAINNPLSQARADAVRNYLISRGVDTSRLVAKGYGSSKPVASNSTEQGKYQNRRIDLLRVR